MLMKTYIDAPEAFYAWRSSTAHFLSNNLKGPGSWGKGGDKRQEFVEGTEALLLYHAVKRDSNLLQQQLEGIAEHAFELAKAMACSRACWVCTMEDPRIKALHGFKIKTDRMEKVELWDEDVEYAKIVDLVVAPMLLKFGNSNGENYGTCRVFNKAQVVMKPKKGAD